MRAAPSHPSHILGNQNPGKERMVSNWIKTQILNRVIDLFYHVLIGKKYSIKCSIQSRKNMVPRKVKWVPKQEEGTSENPKRRGRKSEAEHMMSIIDAYMAGNPPKIWEQINGWERELRSISLNQEVPRGEWEAMVSNLGNSRSSNSLFNKTIQQYWIMKHVVARAMNMNRAIQEEEEEEMRQWNKQLQNQNQEKMENMKSVLLKEITAVQIQASRNNLILGRIKQMLREMKWIMEQKSEIPR